MIIFKDASLEMGSWREGAEHGDAARDFQQLAAEPEGAQRMGAHSWDPLTLKILPQKNILPKKKLPRKTSPKTSPGVAGGGRELPGRAGNPQNSGGRIIFF